MTKKNDRKRSFFFKCTLVIYLCTLWVGAFLPLMAQEGTNKRAWISYNYAFRISSKFTMFGDLGLRKNFTNEFQQFRLVVRPQVRYYLKDHWFVLAGVGAFFNFEDNPKETITEIRPVIGTVYQWPRGKNIALNHVLRIEDRILLDAIEGQENFFRVRYAIATKFRFDNSTFVDYFYSPLALEANVHLNNHQKLQKNFVRASTGFGYVFNGNWTTEFLLTLQSDGDIISGDLNKSDLIFRLRLFHKIR